ncbi:MAG TPA: bifunctional glutamate N-acetyltransferase/amino-acid acetyltransferase ArgJ [Oscillospiraceae bacterium]|nr:bifunctional glutamate N-acetyltransferase/amino-acid acetyltransferase ArgJ [Oscillospiraceae bacterium]
MKDIPGGVCAAIDFRAAGAVAGVKTGNAKKRDLALILSGRPCQAACVVTRNRVKAAPLRVTRRHVEQGNVRGVIANSGNANACAPGDAESALRMCKAAAAATGLTPEAFAVASTGVIGQRLNIEAIERAVPALAASLSPLGSADAEAAIMTTDTRPKEFAVAFPLGGRTARLGGIAKGSGMIHPNMGTMLCFLTTDAAVPAPLLQQALETVVPRTFNRVSVDGDTSTNDCCILLANGAAGNEPLRAAGEDYAVFLEALEHLCTQFARAIAADGEGASRLLTCTVSGASGEAAAETLAMSVIQSPLLKAAMFGADANWGRVLCALGYAGAAFDPEKTDVSFASPAGEIAVCRAGRGLSFDETAAKKILSEQEVEIKVDLHMGRDSVTAWGCDLTYDYVKINGDYRS